jgi:hypothetical protein
MPTIEDFAFLAYWLHFVEALSTDSIVRVTLWATRVYLSNAALAVEDETIPTFGVFRRKAATILEKCTLRATRGDSNTTDTIERLIVPTTRLILRYALSIFESIANFADPFFLRDTGSLNHTHSTRTLWAYSRSTTLICEDKASLTLSHSINAMTITVNGRRSAAWLNCCPASTVPV